MIRMVPLASYRLFQIVASFHLQPGLEESKLTSSSRLLSSVLRDRSSTLLTSHTMAAPSAAAGGTGPPDQGSSGPVKPACIWKISEKEKRKRRAVSPQNIRSYIEFL
ncbi:hypothetical protein AVEN_112450-1 [Araneus ventricosus]|uniref:Uncharacterized protein n=1 Tax=Araneus ventricosus TaxID=182803 RepID=A0A4Y2VBW0_ARAVE|nr:hypothetical protein AVEN_112450-1 [Araneus ventricosus]